MCLTEFEIRLIEIIASELSEKAAEILRFQVKIINKVQRLNQDQEIDFYCLEKGKPKFPKLALFPNQSEEFKLAKLSIIDSDSKYESEALVSLVKGHLFCIEFSNSPKELYHSSNLEIQILALSDPMQKIEPGTGSGTSP
jgi:hypothetical protein